MRRSPFVMKAAVAAALCTITAAMAQSPAALERPAPRIARAEAGRALQAAAATSESAVDAFLRSRGRSDAVLTSLRTGERRAGARGAMHLRLTQEVDGLTVHGAYLKAAFNARGELVHVIDALAPVSSPVAPARVDALTALRAAMARLHPAEAASFRAAGAQGATARFDGGAFFHSPPEVTAVALPMSDGTLARGWLVETWTRKTNQLHHTVVGGDGQVLSVESRTANDSYFVFPVDPGKGGQQLVQGPAPSPGAESPAGWLGNGAQSNIAISGNNADAYLDADSNNRADRGGTPVTDGNFVATANLAVAPTTATNRAVSVQNLFYLNNRIHDILYRHGFDEVAGNFQADNFGRGGKDRDPVQAEAQDGSGTDNANFATPPDGRKPRMQMFLWTGAGATHQVRVNSPVNATYAAMGAAFGAALTPTGLTGDVVVTTPANGCSAISTALAGKVALIDRGTCEFSIKALNAQQAGAIGVIVANNQGGTAIFTMGAGTSANRVRIPAVMIGQNDGAALKLLSAPNATLRALDPQPVQIDASLDSDVVYHEYCHGLTWRMIGGMSGPLAGAIGEGMADGCSMLINGDDVVGEYSASNPLGIRRFRYAGYPLTYADVTGAEVHDDGEIYGAIVWRMMELFGAARRDALFGYLVDGMNHTPSTPAYEHMRDGILAAIAGPASAGSDSCLVWQAFAHFGVGVGAQGVVSRAGAVTITPSSAVPASCSAP